MNNEGRIEILASGYLPFDVDNQKGYGDALLEEE